jgi:hypothetical protein
MLGGLQMNVAELAVSTVGMGSGVGFGFFAVRWLAGFVADRYDKREEQLDAATHDIIDQLRSEVKRLAERLGAVEEELLECKKLHAEADDERRRLNAAMMGLGDAKQTAQLIIAADHAQAKNGVKK